MSGILENSCIQYLQSLLLCLEDSSGYLCDRLEVCVDLHKPLCIINRKFTVIWLHTFMLGVPPKMYCIGTL